MLSVAWRTALAPLQFGVGVGDGRPSCTAILMNRISVYIDVQNAFNTVDRSPCSKLSTDGASRGVDPFIDLYGRLFARGYPRSTL